MKIIAVDDEPLALGSIARVIKNVIPGCEPALFDTPEDALKYAGDNQVDIAFLDIEMGGMNGLILAKYLKDIYGKTNIVFVTGYTEYALDAHTLHPTGYLMKPATEERLRDLMENLRNPVALTSSKRLRVQTFGNFEVFADGKPLSFPRAKSKEVFAYLVHKKGTGCTTQEIAAVLYEDEAKADSVRVYISAMTKALEKAGLADVVIKSFNNIAVDTSKFGCDLYRFLKMDAEAVNEYTGEYMAQYSWAEFMTGYLDGKVL